MNGKHEVPPVIEIAGRLYLVTDWKIDKPVGKSFSVTRLSEDEEIMVRGMKRETKIECWALLTGARKKKSQ